MTIRYHIATTLYKLFPSRFCWADLAKWQIGEESFFKLFNHWGKPTGCINDSEDKKTNSCYCGTWYKGHHCASKEGRKLIQEMKAKQERATELLTDEPPF